MASRGRRVAVVSVRGAICTLVVAALLLRQVAVEWWYLERLRSDDRNAQKLAAERLADLGSRRAVGPRLDILRSDKFRSGEHFAIESLERIGDPAVRELVAEAGRRCGAARSPCDASHAGETAAGTRGLRGTGGECLVNLIVTMTGGDETWNGRDARIDHYRGQLLVSGSPEVHAQIEEILESLRRGTGTLGFFNGVLAALGDNARQELERLATDRSASPFERAFAGFAIRDL